MYPFLPECRENPVILCSFQPLWLQTDCDAQKFREEKGSGLEIKIEPCWLNHEKILPEILKLYRSVRIYSARVKTHLELQQFFLSGSGHLVGTMQEPGNGGMCSALGKSSAVWGVGKE